MNNSNVVLVVPQWVLDATRLAQRDWIPFVGTIALSMVIIGLTALFKGRWNVAKEEARAKILVRRLILILSVSMSGLSAWGYFIEQHMAVLKNIPYVGTYMVSVLGIVWGVYSFGLKFRSLETKGAVWANVTMPTPPVTTPVAPPADGTTPSAFVSQ